MFSANFWPRLQSFYQFLKVWLKRHWQSLSLLLIGVLIPLQIFIILALKIWRSEGGLIWDISVLEAIHATANPQLDTFAKAFTNLGTIQGVFPFSALIALGLLLYQRWRSLTYFLFSLLGCSAINRIAKLFWHRDRPMLWDSAQFHGFSFPSGHSMSSMIFVATLAILLWETRWRWLVLSVGSLFVLIIGWTRLYLSAHYPSDILAGWMISLSWAIGISLLVRPQLKPPNLLLNSDEPMQAVPEDELLPR